MDEQRRKQLSSRLSDLMGESERGYITYSFFLDPAELSFARSYISGAGLRERTFFFGGYENAERKCVFFLPEYYADMIDDISDYNVVFSTLCTELSDAVKMIRIEGSGYRKLSHRDFLGAVLNLGIARDAIGDLCLPEDNTCVLFSSPSVAELIKSGCERIGSDKVKIKEMPLSDGFSYERKTKSVSDTIASDRLDCVVSSLSGESREKSKSLILSGFVELNYEQVTKTDIRVSEGDTVVVRGVGKFIIDGIHEETKKGRIRLAARKFI